jgi:hypothetical protein
VTSKSGCASYSAVSCFCIQPVASFSHQQTVSYFSTLLAAGEHFVSLHHVFSSTTCSSPVG